MKQPIGKTMVIKTMEKLKWDKEDRMMGATP
jgi:hypothetical protein